MTSNSNPLMNENLTFDEYLQTKPNSIKDLIVTSLRVLDTFTKLTYDGKSFEEIISEYSFLDKDTRQDKIIFVLKRFSLWCQQDHPEITYQTRGRTEYHKKKQPRTIMSYTSRIRDVLDSVYGIELNVRNFKKKLSIPDPNDFDPEPFTKQEIRTICDYAHSPKQKLHYMTLKDSAMRLGESVAIRKKHIDITKIPVEITVTASITKTNRTRMTYVTRETAPMLINHLKRLSDNDLVFGSNENQQKATDNAESDFWRLREELKKILPKFDEKYEENGRHKKNIHSLRAFTATQCAEAVDEGFGHGICGHKKYLGQYIRNQDKMPELYKRAENHLMIYETIEVIDQSSELSELRNEISRIKRDSESFKKLTEEKIRLEIEIENQRKELLLARQHS